MMFGSAHNTHGAMRLPHSLVGMDLAEGIGHLYVG
jgi:hypothetical protein